jgi:RNA recognition motif-containing protein
MDKKKLFVAKLPFSATNSDLENKFAQAGTVVSAEIIIDRERNRSKGFGFVVMGSEEEAQNAIQMFNGHEWDGQILVVNIAQPKTENGNRGGGGYGGNRSGGRNDSRGRRDNFRGSNRRY